MPLTVQRFVKYYMFNYNAPELTIAEQKMAKKNAIFLGIITLGIFPLFCRVCLFDRKFKIVHSDFKQDSKTSKVAQKHLNRSNQQKTTNLDEEIKQIRLKARNEYKAEAIKKEKIAIQAEIAPPLTKIAQITPTSDLEKTISPASFFKGDPLALLFFAPKEMTIEGIEKLFGSGVLDNAFNIPVSFLINQEKESYYNKVLNDSKCKTTILDRIEALDKEVQLKERFRRMNGSSNLKVQHLLAPWSQNKNLQLQLMMVDELAEVKLKDLSSDVDLSGSRISRLVSYLREFPKSPEKLPDSPQELLLRDFPHLKAEIIDLLLSELPPIAFALISPSEVPKLNIEKMSPAQINCLLGSKEQVHSLSLKQIMATFGKVKDKFNYQNLSKKQVAEFLKNLDQVDPALLDKETFKYIVHLTDYTSSSKKEIIQKLLKNLDPKFIYKFEKFLSEKQWSCMDQAKLLALDPSKLSQESFLSMVPDSYGNTAKKFISKIPPQDIQKWQHLFDKKHWPHLNGKQINALNPKNLDAGIFSAIFYNTIGGRHSEAANLLRQIEPSKIPNWQHLFKNEHWGYLNSRQIKALNPNTLDNNIFKAIFHNTISGYYSEAAKLLQTFNPQEVISWSQYFDKDHWSFLTVDQILAHDFKHGKMDQTCFDAMVRGRESKIIPKLSKDQLQSLQPYITKKYSAYLKKQ